MASAFTPFHHGDDSSVAEPTLEDLFAEPIVQLFMKRDHVSASDMQQQIDYLKRTYTAGQA